MCDHPKSAKAKRCRSCAAKHMNEDPEIIAKRRIGVAAHYADPANRAIARKRIDAINAKLMADPKHIEKLRANGRRSRREVLGRPDVLAKTFNPEACARRGRAISAAKLAHIPVAYQAEYRALVRSGNATAAEAGEIIAQQIAHDNNPIRILDRYYGGKPAKG